MTDSVSLGERTQSCAICRGQSSEIVLSQACDYITGENFAVRRCRDCGVAFTDPRPSEMDVYYPQRYRRYRRVVLTALRRLYRTRARAWSDALAGPGTVLELGCGDGWMLRALQDRGWKVIGIERTVEAAATAFALNRVPVFVGDLTAVRYELFNAIILFQVLEHLPDPMATLRQCARLLGPRGRMIICVPNFASWQARVFGKLWFHLDVPRHLYHFSPRSLARALDGAGFDVTRIRYVSIEHDPYGWVQSGLNRFGFEHNLLTKLFMGLARPGRSIAVVGAMALLAAPLAIAGLGLAVAGWVAGAGAIMEIRAVKR